MGCDIHLFVEYKLKANPKAIWKPCGFGDRFSDRNYAMFNALRKVQNSAYMNIEPLRGLPDDISSSTHRMCFKWVVDDEKYDPDFAEDTYKKSDADQWVASNYSIERTVNSTRYVSCPDWHSFSWCTSDEMQSAVDAVFRKIGDGDERSGDHIEWTALATYMKALEDNGKYDVRAVFWFDN